MKVVQRYKIVPAKRNSTAARCIGKERVGLFGETGAECATAILGNSALSVNLMRRRGNANIKH
jgi:hypothetical protein